MPADGELLPVARDHEQRVVDREPQPEPGDEVDREHREVGHLDERSAARAASSRSTPSRRAAAATRRRRPRNTQSESRKTSGNAISSARLRSDSTVSATWRPATAPGRRGRRPGRRANASIRRLVAALGALARRRVNQASTTSSDTTVRATADRVGSRSGERPPQGRRRRPPRRCPGRAGRPSHPRAVRHARGALGGGILELVRARPASGRSRCADRERDEREDAGERDDERGPACDERGHLARKAAAPASGPHTARPERRRSRGGPAAGSSADASTRRRAPALRRARGARRRRRPGAAAPAHGRPGSRTRRPRRGRRRPPRRRPPRPCRR